MEEAIIGGTVRPITPSPLWLTRGCYVAPRIASLVCQWCGGAVPEERQGKCANCGGTTPVPRKPDTITVFSGMTLDETKRVLDQQEEKVWELYDSDEHAMLDAFVGIVATLAFMVVSFCFIAVWLAG